MAVINNNAPNSAMLNAIANYFPLYMPSHASAIKLGQSNI